jgi:peptidoglycan/xylan/chitin deacetylase (PgdA/CDA1 family)
MRLYRLYLPARMVYPAALFRVTTCQKELVLTFDDGPDPQSTLPLAEILERHKVKAVFFCSGEKAEAFPSVIGQLKAMGHIIGNHGYEHLDGCKTPSAKYIENVRRASPFTSDNLFRPPYGKMKLSQYNELKKEFRIILWDLMPYDFDKELGGKGSLNILKRMTRPGSVIVLHDTGRSSLLSFIDEFISWSLEEGYSFVTGF